jgi:hypothetical protein
MANVGIVSLNGGEFTPQIDVRADVEKYSSGCRHLENMLPRIYGPVTRRPGTKYVVSAVDIDVILPSIVAYENVGSCYENEVVSTLPTGPLIPVFICYENDIVCFENETAVAFQTIVFDSSIYCYENDVVFHENEIVTN